MSQLPPWADDANFPAGSEPWNGQPTRVEPSNGIKSRGFLPGRKPPAGWLNWILGVLFDESNAQDERLTAIESDKIDGLPSSVDNALVRFDGTTGKAVQGSPITLDDAGTLAYPTPVARETTIEPTSGICTGTFTLDAGVFLRMATDSAQWAISLKRVLPHRAVITRIRALVEPGTGRSPGSRMSLQVHKPAYQVSPEASGGIAGLALVSEEDLGGASVQTIDSGTISIEVGEAFSAPAFGDGLVVTVESGATAGAFPDRLLALVVSWTDPGPRNL